MPGINIPFSHKEGVAWVHVQIHRDACGTCVWCVGLDENLEKWGGS